MGRTQSHSQVTQPNVPHLTQTIKRELSKAAETRAPASSTTDSQPPIGREPVGNDSVRYRRPDRPRLGRPLFRDREISLCFRFSHGPKALELSANRQCLSKCGEPSSGVKILRCNPRDRFRPHDPELQQAVQLPLTHWMTALNATARE